MRTTLNIDAELLAEAARLTGIDEKAALVRLGLEALIARETARRPSEASGGMGDRERVHHPKVVVAAALGGTEKKLERPPRRRTDAT